MTPVEEIRSLKKDERITLAKTKMGRVLDHFLYVIELRANNAFVVHSEALTSQIPQSFAANAFNVFQRSMHQIEIVRLCALWDGVDPDKENIPTVIELVDDPDIIEALAEETRSYHANMGGRVFKSGDEDEEMLAQALEASNAQFGAEQAERARTELNGAIKAARAISKSERLSSVMNIRDKHLAHSLTETRREKKKTIRPMTWGDGTDLFESSIPIVEGLYCWVAGKSFSIADSQRIDQENAEALWKGCKFEVLY
jgi:hypothetical protein